MVTTWALHGQGGLTWAWVEHGHNHMGTMWVLGGLGGHG